MGWSQCLRDLVTKLETPQFALHFDIYIGLLCAVNTVGMFFLEKCGKLFPGGYSPIWELPHGWIWLD